MAKSRVSTNKGLTTFGLIIVGFILIAGSAYWYYVDDIKPYLNKEKERACTMEAKLCPDGSAVGRSGPNCEFAKCPVSRQLNKTELKYSILSFFNPMFFCDPDFYPIAREDENILAVKWFQQANEASEEFLVILKHNGFNEKKTFSQEEKLLIYREHKKLQAIPLTPEEGKYTFHVHTGGESGGPAFKGIIDEAGKITVLEKVETFNTCPICTTLQIY